MKKRVSYICYWSVSSDVALILEPERAPGQIQLADVLETALQQSAERRVANFYVGTVTNLHGDGGLKNKKNKFKSNNDDFEEEWTDIGVLESVALHDDAVGVVDDELDGRNS